MNIDTAEKILKNLRVCDLHLNEVLGLIEEIEDEIERRDMRRRAADAVGVIYAELTMKLQRDFPNL